MTRVLQKLESDFLLELLKVHQLIDSLRNPVTLLIYVAQNHGSHWTGALRWLFLGGRV